MVISANRYKYNAVITSDYTIKTAIYISFMKSIIKKSSNYAMIKANACDSY